MANPASETVAAGTAPKTMETELTVMMFTDIVGSTELKSKLGTTAYAALLARHNHLFESQLPPGIEFLKHTGDGYFAKFSRASDAVRFAVAFQTTMKREEWGALPVVTRVGIHAGEVTALHMAGRDDIVGFAADVTARIMSLAVGGQILLSRVPFDDARQFVRGVDDQTGNLKWLAHGLYLFKGAEDPMELYEVGFEGISPLAPPPTSEKARRFIPQDLEELLGWRPAIGLPVPHRLDWTLTEKIGEGGFGEVWLAAHHRTHDRRVFKFCFSPDRLRSFKRELTLFRLLREVLGDRKDIARLYDVALDRPPYLLESEYAPGGNLIDWAQKRGGIATLPLSERLELLARVADAVAAAHSVGVLHKDLKPSNILIRDKEGPPEPVLADFGIGMLADRTQLRAHAITETGFTQITDNDSSRTGTRIYAPPELLSGKAFTIQGDVYALGVMLYQLVVGDLQRPLSAGWERDVADDILREDIAACVDGDLSRRLASADLLRQRLVTVEQRRNEREDARKRQTLLEQRAKRTRLAVTVGVILALLLLTGGMTAGIYIRRLTKANAATEQQRLIAVKSAEDALAQEKEAKRQTEIARAVNRFIKTALVSSDPNNGGKQSMLVTDAMRQAIGLLDNGALKDQPEAEANLRNTIAMILDGNADSLQALLQATKALEMDQRLFKGDHLDVATSLNNVASYLNSLGRSAEALPKYEAALEMYQRLFKGDHPDVASGLNNVAGCLNSLGRSAEALPKFEAALEMRQRLFKGDHPDLASSLNNVAGCLNSLGHSAEALPKYETALEMRQRLFKGDYPEVAMSLNNVAGCLNSLGHSAEALPKYEEALEMYQRLFKGDHPDVARSLNNVAGCLNSLGHSAEALPKYEEALEMYQRLFKGDHPNVAKSLNNVAYCLDSLGRSAEALPKYEAALEMRQRLFKGDHPDVASSLNNVASCLNSLGRSAEALPKYEAALEMYQRLFKGDHPDVAMSLNNVAYCLDSLGRSAEALPKYEAALEMRQRLFKGDHPDVATSLNNVAYCLNSLGRSAEALPEYEEALEIDQRLFKGDHPAVARGLNNVASCLDSLDRFAEALPKYEAALEMYQRLFKRDHPNVATSLNNVAYCLNSLGRFAEALPKFEAALEMRQRLFKGDHPNVASSLNNVASCLDSLGRSGEAQQRAEQAVAMSARILPAEHPIRKACDDTLARIKAKAATQPATTQP